MSHECRPCPSAASVLDVPNPEILEAVPLFAGRPAGYWQCEALGGITNRTYRVSAGGGESREIYALRIATETTHYLDRVAELHNARIAGELGIAPQVLHADGRLLVTRFLSGARPLRIGEFGDSARLEQIGRLLRRLQGEARAFIGARHPFGEIDKYLKLHSHPRSLDLRRSMQPVADAIAATPITSVPAHIDPNAGNFLLCPDGSLQLIDWEFSAMADPCWDVAAILTQAPDDDTLVRRFVATVLGRADDAILARVALFRAAMFLVAGSWCAMEAAFRADAALLTMADSYLDQGAVALSDPRMPRWLSGHYPSA